MSRLSRYKLALRQLSLRKGTGKRPKWAISLRIVELEERTVPTGFALPGAGAFTPQQIGLAYQIERMANGIVAPNIVFPGSIVGDGSGQTIAVVDAYDNPNLVSSTLPGGGANPAFASSDLAMFDKQYGLPDPPSFLKMNQAGVNGSYPGQDPTAGTNNNSWEGEEALDVEWTHAIAPGANIVLIEATDDTQLIATAAQAAALPGVSVVSMSWGTDGDIPGTEMTPASGSFGGSIAGSTSRLAGGTSGGLGAAISDTAFTTPTGHQGVTFVAASGDNGSPGSYPAYSPNVLAVGGTTLVLNANNTVASETAWSGSGGGQSETIAEPSYQQGVQNSGYRQIPDVSFDGDPTTGVSVYDSFDFGSSTPWTQKAGTSLSAPAWAGLIAIVDQGRALAGQSSLDGATQTMPAIYNLYATNPGDFRDITSGSNGQHSAGAGYDMVTGMGSPLANLLVLDLALYTLTAPIVTNTTGTITYTAGQSSTVVDAGITVTTPTRASIVGATIAITDNYVSGEDQLGFTPTGNIQGSFNSGTGVLTLTGADTAAAYQAALQSVTFFDSSATPTAGVRAITFSVNDGSEFGISTRLVSVSSVLTLPSVTLADSQIGVSYDADLTPDGGLAPYAFSFVTGSLPAGISLSSSGVLSGSPTSTGSFSFTVQVTDAGGASSSQVFTLTSDPAISTVSLSSSVPFPQFGVSVTFTAVVVGENPTGTVIFTDLFGGVTTTLGTVTLTSGTSQAAITPTSTLPSGAHFITASYSGDADNSPSSATLASTPPTVTRVIVNGKNANPQQISMVTDIEVTFNTPVAISPGAFKLTRVGLPNAQPGDGATVTPTFTTTTNASGQMVLTLAFAGANTNNGSLADGNWTLTINHALVTSSMTGATLATDYTQSGIRRLFGLVVPGGTTVDATDYAMFVKTYGLAPNSVGYNAAFAYTTSGPFGYVIGAADFSAFSSRFGESI